MAGLPFSVFASDWDDLYEKYSKSELKYMKGKSWAGVRGIEHSPPPLDSNQYCAQIFYDGMYAFYSPLLPYINFVIV